MRYRQLIHHPRRNLGFTLIELVVVIVIITVLLAILLPSLKGARDQARAVQCASNLRQWGLAIQSYASEENDTIPAVAAANPGTIWSSSTVAGNASRAQLSADKISRYMGNFSDPGTRPHVVAHLEHGKGLYLSGCLRRQFHHTLMD